MNLKYSHTIYASKMADFLEDALLKRIIEKSYRKEILKFSKEHLNDEYDDDETLIQFCTVKNLTVFNTTENLSFFLEGINVSMTGDKLITWVEDTEDEDVFVDVIFWEIQFQTKAELETFVVNQLAKEPRDFEPFVDSVKDKLVEKLL